MIAPSRRSCPTRTASRHRPARRPLLRAGLRCFAADRPRVRSAPGTRAVARRVARRLSSRSCSVRARRRFDRRVSLGELARQPIDVGGCRRLILTGALDFECRRAQLLVDHVPGRRGPRHADLVLGVELSQLPISRRDGRSMALLGVVKSGRRARELLLEIDARRSLDRARDDDRQIARQRLIPVNVEGGRMGSREIGLVRHDDDDRGMPARGRAGGSGRKASSHRRVGVSTTSAAISRFSSSHLAACSR